MGDNKIDLVIRGGRVVSPSSTIEADVAIAGEQIAAVAAPGLLPKTDNDIDDRLVFYITQNSTKLFIYIIVLTREVKV